MLWPSLQTRQCQPEWMDDPNADPEQLRKALQFIRRINTLLGYTRTALRYLDQFSRRWEKERTYQLIDLATGSADLPVAMLDWADRTGHRIKVIGIDLHEATISTARRRVNDDRLTLIRADALNLPLADGGVDYAFTSLFLHHLSDADVVRAMQEMSRVASRGIFVADLLRKQRAYGWIKLLSCFANPIVRHDAPASVAQSFTKAEILHLRDRAGLSFTRYATNFGHRFVLTGEKV